MTDFLGRIAARAVGAAAVAQPRLPGLFEPPGAAGGTTLEVVEEEVVLRPPRSPRSEDTAAPEPSPAPALSPAVPAPPATERGEQLTEILAGQPPELAASASEPAAPPAAALREREPVHAEAVTVAAAAPEVASAPRAAVAAVPLTRAQPAADAREPAPSVATRAEEPPPVHVHIGRLEVRANVPEPPRERPRREPSRPEALSLADYLRGKREGRA
jgi:hypothetical protein